MRFQFRSNVVDTVLRETLQILILIGLAGGPFRGTQCEIEAVEMFPTAAMHEAMREVMTTADETALTTAAVAGTAAARRAAVGGTTTLDDANQWPTSAQFRADLTKDYAALATVATAAFAMSSLAAVAESKSVSVSVSVSQSESESKSESEAVLSMADAQPAPASFAATSTVAFGGYTPPVGSLLALHRISKDTQHNSYSLPASDNTNDSNEIDSMDYVMTKHIASHATQTRTNRTTAEDLSSLSLLSASDGTAAASSSSSTLSFPSTSSSAASTLTVFSSVSSLAGNQKLNVHSSSGGSGSGSSRRSPSDRSGSGVGNRTTTFQHIGSQRIALKSTARTRVPTTTASTAATALATASSKHTNARISAKKVESKYILPKPQKTDAPMLNYIFDTFSSANKHHHHDQRYGPHFEDVQRLGQPTNMTVQAGSSIHLNCRISLLQDKTVSWVRHNAQGEHALDLLTVGLHTYTGDQRYKMEFQYPNNWRLKITNVKKDDEAMYECQISTHPPRVIQINLLVNAPKVMIVDEFGDPLQEKYYEIDSTLQLSCVVRNVAMATSVVYWKHGEDVLNYDVTRGGISVKTELMDDGANSTLSIAKINKSDSGNYTCSISEFQNFSIVVHILNGESFAELHHGGAAPAVPTTFHHTLAINLALLALLLALCLPPNHIHR